MAINLSTLSVPTLVEQLDRKNAEMTWLEYATYLYKHKDMSFSQGQCLSIAGNALKSFNIDDIAAQTNFDVEYLQKESDKINFDKQIYTKEAELEIYKTIIPAEPMRFVGKLEQYFTGQNGPYTICVFISVGENEFVSIWHQYTEEQETDNDIFSFPNYKRVNEFKTYHDYETFMKECQWSPKNINYQTENNTVEGPLYDSYVSIV